MTTPPPENRQCIKIDEGSFYLSMTTSQQINAADLASQLHNLCTSALHIGATLREAAAVGVTKAAAVVAVLNTVEAFSDADKAGAFLAALAAARDA